MKVYRYIVLGKRDNPIDFGIDLHWTVDPD